MLTGDSPMAKDATDEVRLTRRQWWGLNVSPLFLRLVLGVVFLWAGLGKFLSDVPVQGPIADAVQTVWGSSAPPAEGGGSSPANAPSGEVNVRGVRVLGASIYMAGNPPVGDNGVKPRAIWPGFISSPLPAKAQAFAVAITEILVGMFLLAGLLSRLSALGVIIIMFGAVWLSQLGPAIQSGNTTLGFLPDYPRFSHLWQNLFFQLSMLAMAGAVLLTGAGCLSVDAVLFRRRDKHEIDVE